MMDVTASYHLFCGLHIYTQELYTAQENYLLFTGCPRLTKEYEY